MMKHASLALALVFGAALFGSTASAQLLDVQSTVNVTGSATSEEATADVSVNAETDTTASSSASATEETSALNLNIVRSKMDENTEYTTSGADRVRTEASLESYAAATVRADERLESLTVEDGRLAMTYHQKAKLLWIIPASMKVRVTADAAGDVSVRYPWYAFLMQAEESRADVEARLAAEIKDINDSIEVASTAELSGGATSTGITGNPEIRRWARIIESVYIAISGSARVDADAEASS